MARRSYQSHGAGRAVGREQHGSPMRRRIVTTYAGLHKLRLIMRRLDPRIHPASQRVIRRRWIAGSIPGSSPGTATTRWVNDHEARITPILIVTPDYEVNIKT